MSNLSNPQIQAAARGSCTLESVTYLKQTNLRRVDVTSGQIALTCPPITRLPPELLFLVFEHLHVVEQSLCVMSRRHWRLLIRSLWPELKTSPVELLHWAVNGRHIECLKMLRRRDLKDFAELIAKVVQTGNIRLCKEIVMNPNKESWPRLVPVEALNESLKFAAYEGYTECMKILRDWCATEFNQALAEAAGGNQIDCMKLLKEWGATDFDRALWRSAQRGHVDCLKLAKKWGATYFDRALVLVVCGDHKNYMNLTKGWNVTKFNRFLRCAASKGHIDSMRFAKNQGATDFNGALEAAANGGPIGAKDWDPTDFDIALEGAWGDHKECMKLLKEWGATAIDCILEGRYGCITLLETWIEEQNEE